MSLLRMSLLLVGLATAFLMPFLVRQAIATGSIVAMLVGAALIITTACLLFAHQRLAGEAGAKALRKPSQRR
jgi:hypothetical protein